MKHFPPYTVTPFYERQILSNEHRKKLRRIVEPSDQEFASRGTLDTSGEEDNTVAPGFQHKYAPTGLILVTGKCFSYCRFCFRKRIVRSGSNEACPDYAAIVRYIRQHPEINNVLLSGGDPFTLTTDELHGILDHLLPIPHLDYIRFGTKALVHSPQRFADPDLPDLFERIRKAGKAAVIILHVDHCGELSPESQSHIRLLASSGVEFLHQAVLLKGVNDDVKSLVDLFKKMHSLGVRPYYLFQARPVRGATHFQVPLARGVRLVAKVMRHLSGPEKTFRYIMSHVTGKIEILNLSKDNRLFMRYHQNKTESRIGEVFSRPSRQGACWLDELPIQ